MRESYFDLESRAILEISPHALGEGYVVCRVNTPWRHRGKGIARELMRQALGDADVEGIILWLDINPYGDMTYESLAAWYERCGFEHQEVGYSYRRLPKKVSPCA